MSTPCTAAKRVVNTLLERKDLLLLLQVYSIPSPKLHSVCSPKEIEGNKQTNRQTPQQVSASSSHLTNIFFQEANDNTS